MLSLLFLEFKLSRYTLGMTPAVRQNVFQMHPRATKILKFGIHRHVHVTVNIQVPKALVQTALGKLAYHKQQ